MPTAPVAKKATAPTSSQESYGERSYRESVGFARALLVGLLLSSPVLTLVVLVIVRAVAR
jgi:hypothetical protein